MALWREVRGVIGAIRGGSLSAEHRGGTGNRCSGCAGSSSSSEKRFGLKFGSGPEIRSKEQQLK